MGTTAETQRLRHGEGEEAIRPGQLLLQVVVEPLLRLIVLTLGAMAIAAGVQDAVTPSAALARLEAVSGVSGAAVEDGMHRFVVRRGQGGMPRDILRRIGGEDVRDGGHGWSPRIRVLIRS